MIEVTPAKKKNLIILTLALLLALPLFGLAADAAIPGTHTVQAAPLGGQNSRRRSRTPQTPAIPQGSFVDADNDGNCDICGLEPGEHTASPNYTDENKDGVCDHCGTSAGQGSGRGRNRK